MPLYYILFIEINGLHKYYQYSNMIFDNRLNQWINPRLYKTLLLIFIS